MEELTKENALLLEENAKLKEKLQITTEHLKRYTAPERNKTYYQANKEEIRKKTQEFLTPDKKKEYNRRYYLKKKGEADNQNI